MHPSPKLTTTKVCSQCKRRKPKTEFKRKAGGKDGLNSECKSCGNARSRAWVAANPEKLAAINARSYEKTKAKRRLARRAKRLAAKAAK